MSFDSVFNGDPRTAGVSSSGKAQNGIDIASGQVYFKDDSVAGWQPTGSGSVTSDQVVNESGVTGATVTAALDNLFTGVVQTASRLLTSAEIKSLSSSPVQIVPGRTSQYLGLVSATFEFIPGTTPYTIDGNSILTLQVGTANSPSHGSQSNSVQSQVMAGSVHTLYDAVASTVNVATQSDVTNFKGVGIFLGLNGGADATVGDGTMKVTVTFVPVALS
jgi:hypothetical protein